MLADNDTKHWGLQFPQFPLIATVKSLSPPEESPSPESSVIDDDFEEHSPSQLAIPAPDTNSRRRTWDEAFDHEVPESNTALDNNRNALAKTVTPQGLIRNLYLQAAVVFMFGVIVSQHFNPRTNLQIHGRLNRLQQKRAVVWHCLKIKNSFHDHQDWSTH
ncbi:hypothetical protein T069G_02834 [Trichoderma breve]|uniref:Uncharacterized protein n=1 Tax=Trichoderma breve TaxID=2034170 RepID=A0A9W9BEX6_9HYPO|nr:hypothetical protein T069G_02834 [Trichoderma breve]KAJ4861880.1 hypothetical protein T069G_02834 [Trichoderma breve]